MSKQFTNDFAAVLLAAGKGSRMKSNLPKVLHKVNGTPLLTHVLRKIHKLNVGKIVVVVKYGKDEVISHLPDYSDYAEQGDLYGTAKAVESALGSIDLQKHIMVINGDDSLFYSLRTFKNVMEKHINTESDITFITLTKKDPSGFGRIIYNKKRKFVRIVEEKDATDEERQITEVNDGVYIFKKDFLTKYLPKINPSPITGEYYLTDLLECAVKKRKKVSTYLLSNSLEFFGISTQEDVKKANLFNQELLGRKKRATISI